MKYRTNKNNAPVYKNHGADKMKRPCKVFNNSQERTKFNQRIMIKKKTELCETFMNRGQCPYGQSCSFAHGYNELQKKTHLSWNHKVKAC